MNKRFSFGGLAAAALVVGVVGIVAAPAISAGPGDIIKQRQETMKKMGGHMKAIKAFVETGEGSAADIARRAGEINEISMKIPDLFPQGTSLDDVMDPQTGAKPDIWKDFAKFKSAAGHLGELSHKLQDVASDGADRQQIGAAFGDMGKNGCGGCHEPFRKKLEKK